MTTTLRGLNKVDPAYRPDMPTKATSEVSDYLVSRIEWCHRQATEALTTLEAIEWYAEQNGLIDALIERDCSHDYQDTPTLLERYRRGLQDGRVLIQVAKTDSYAPNLQQC